MLGSRLTPSIRRILVGAALLTAAGCGDGGGGTPTPVEGHPRLFVTKADVERLRGWAKPANPYWEKGLKNTATQFKERMDQQGLTLDADCKTSDGFLPCEWFMEVFAFMSLVSPDQADRDDYGKRAKKILMSMIDTASQGPADGAGEIRASNFAVGDRSRGAGRGFGLTVDWIYPYLEGGDKEKIRNVFLRWADEDVHATVTNYNHPEPVGVFNDPSLIADPLVNRWATNNYFTGHGRNLGLMAMALDPGDDPDGKLHAYLDNSTGAFLYMTDETLRTDSKGGQMPEGFEYGPLTASYVMDLLFALHTAGLDDTEKRGDQVSWETNPFWKEEAMKAFIHGLAPSLHPLDYPGPYHDYPSMGDMETYEPYTGVYGDPILYFGPLAIMAREKGDKKMYDQLKWVTVNLPPGGGGDQNMEQRSGSIYSPQNSIGFFMLMDPDAGPPVDPTPDQALDYFGEGMRLLYSRTGWTQDDSYFTFQVAWTGIDHRHADANNFGLHRKGEWITKEHAGYGAYESFVHNNVSIQNDPPKHDDDLTMRVYNSGSQVTYDADGDGEVLAYSFAPGYSFALGDATKMHNSKSEGTYGVAEATRSIVWLKPDHVITYDRAETKSDGRFKRYYLQTPPNPSVEGSSVSATTALGQQLFFRMLLPAGASIASDSPPIEYESGGEPMDQRIMVESMDKAARFLAVIQGADGGASPDDAILVSSASGTAFHGAVVKGTLVAFPVNLKDAFSSVSFDVPESTTSYLITGLTPNGMYMVTADPPSGGQIHVTIQPGAGKAADSGGVLSF